MPLIDTKEGLVSLKEKIRESLDCHDNYNFPFELEDC